MHSGWAELGSFRLLASMTKRFRERENGYPEVEIIRPLTMKDAAAAAQQMRDVHGCPALPPSRVVHWR